MNEIDIAFVEKCESWRLESRFFPSKVGGKPAWLNLKNLPAPTDVECQICKNPCIFLCQIYAPYEDYSRAFHRTLFVFICKNVQCCLSNDNSNLKILRCQLPRDNEFYPFEPPNEVEHWRPDIHVEKWTKTCTVCGILGPKHCAKCKKVTYCCRAHQLVDWKAGHKSQCQESKSVKDKDGSILFPEYELAMETVERSDKKSTDDELEIEKKEIAHFEALVNSGKAGTMQSEIEIDNDLSVMSNCDRDKSFTKFSKTIEEHPDQVLRYDRGGTTPLYIASSGKPLNIPKCEECNGDRQFEFQIMPQLLNYLNLNDILGSIDWGTLLIYTCRNSCEPKSAAYVREYIWKQDVEHEKTKELSTE